MPATYISSGKKQNIPDSAEALAEIIDLVSLPNSEIHLTKNLPLELLRKASIIQVKKRIEDNLTPDIDLIQAVEALDEAHTSLNLISERLITWYSQITGSSRVKVDCILSEKELSPQLCVLKEYYKSSDKMVVSLSEYINLKAPLIVPSMVELLDSQLASRLIASAGSLSKLARMPSSTIQLLGAEKALFRHISDGSPPPKHGFLYQHPLVKKASKKEKGRISRKLAAKVAIACKLDYYSDNNE